MKKFISACLIFLLCTPIICGARPNPSFDSLLHAAVAIPDDGARLHQLNLLEEKLQEASMLQIISFDEALLATYTALKRDSNILTTRLNLGVELTDAGRYDEAHAHLFQALQLAERSQDHTKQIKVYLGLGFLYKCMGEVTRNKKDFEQAMAYYNKAQSLIGSTKTDKYIPQVLDNIAQLYDLQQEHQQAIALYKQVITLNHKSGNLRDLVNNYMNLGISYKNSRQYDGALQAYQSAQLFLDSTKGSSFSQMVLNNNLAILYHEMGNDAAGEALALRTNKEAAATGLTAVQVDMMGLLSRIYERQKRYPEALAYNRDVMRLKDTLLNKEKAGQIADMQSKYEAGKKDERITEQTEALYARKKQNRYLWAGIGLLSLAGIIIYIIQRRTIKLNARVVAQHNELQDQKAALQQANDIKDRLFSVISHDLRIPVNSLTSFTVLVDNAGLSQDKLRQYTAVLKQTLGDTAALLENLLHFAGTQMKSSKALLQPVDAGETVNEVIRLLQPSIEKKNIQVINDMLPDTMAFADPDMLSLIFRNLLSNAVKFSQKGTRVYIYAVLKDNHITCIVKDEGTGMPPDLVKSFNSAVNSTTHTYQSTTGTQQEKGTGLGLMLCKTFAGLMKGDIRVESKTGEGSAFFLTLPLPPR